MNKLILACIFITSASFSNSQKNVVFDVSASIGVSVYNTNNSQNLAKSKTFFIPTSSFGLGYSIRRDYHISINFQSWNYGSNSNDSIRSSATHGAASLRFLCMAKDTDKWKFLVGPEIGGSRIINSYENTTGNVSELKFGGSNFGLCLIADRHLSRRFSIFFDFALTHHSLKANSFTLDDENKDQVNNIPINRFFVSFFGTNNRFGLRYTP
jgi:hypothetical protein